MVLVFGGVRAKVRVGKGGWGIGGQCVGGGVAGASLFLAAGGKQKQRPLLSIRSPSTSPPTSPSHSSLHNLSHSCRPVPVGRSGECKKFRVIRAAEASKDRPRSRRQRNRETRNDKPGERTRSPPTTTIYMYSVCVFGCVGAGVGGWVGFWLVDWMGWVGVRE